MVQIFNCLHIYLKKHPGMICRDAFKPVFTTIKSNTHPR